MKRQVNDMERLTEYIYEQVMLKGLNIVGIGEKNADILTEGIRKLAAYEDTGFTPEEQEDIKACLDVEGDGKSGEDTLRDLLELMRYRKTGLTPEEIVHNSIAFGNDRAYFFDQQKELKHDRDYWEREAKKWCEQLFIIRKWLHESGYDMDDILRKVTGN
jgi:hypothetical protein